MDTMQEFNNKHNYEDDTVNLQFYLHCVLQLVPFVSNLEKPKTNEFGRSYFNTLSFAVSFNCDVNYCLLF